MSEEKFHDAVYQKVRLRALLSKVEKKLPDNILYLKFYFDRLQKVYGVQSRLSADTFDTDRPASDKHLEDALKTLKIMDNLLNQFEKLLEKNNESIY